MALLILIAAAAAACAGCGGEAEGQVARRLQREDLIAVAAALTHIEPAVSGELAGARDAWRTVAHGLPRSAPADVRSRLVRAAASAASLRLPSLLSESQAVTLTGPAAEIAGLVRSYALLSTRGWAQILAMLEVTERGTAAQARFARANVALYIESVYDGHFTLAQVGKKLLAGYRKLGGEKAFAAALPAREVGALARAYSEGSARLHPHATVRLGS